MAFVWDYLGEPVPEKWNQSGFTGAWDILLQVNKVMLQLNIGYSHSS